MDGIWKCIRTTHAQEMFLVCAVECVCVEWALAEAHTAGGREGGGVRWPPLLFRGLTGPAAES